MCSSAPHKRPGSQMMSARTAHESRPGLIVPNRLPSGQRLCSRNRVDVWCRRAGPIGWSSSSHPVLRRSRSGLHWLALALLNVPSLALSARYLSHTRYGGPATDSRLPRPLEAGDGGFLGNILADYPLERWRSGGTSQWDAAAFHREYVSKRVKGTPEYSGGKAQPQDY